MPISLVYGKPGTGKSQFSLWYALKYAEAHDKSLITNFLLNPLGLLQYCKIANLPKLEYRIRSGDSRIYYQPLNDSIDDLLLYPDSIIICDEAAIYFPSRGSTYKTPQKVLSDLVQVRHQNQHLFLLCQSESQIDSQLRALADEVFLCDGSYNFDGRGKQRLIARKIMYFLPDQYDNWKTKPQIKKNPLKSRFACTKQFGGYLSIKDIYLFSCYNSFNLIHSESEASIKKNTLYPSYVLHSGSTHYSVDGSTCSVPHLVLGLQGAKTLSKLFDFLPARLYRFRHLFIIFVQWLDFMSPIEFKLFSFIVFVCTYLISSTLIQLFT